MSWEHDWCSPTRSDCICKAVVAIYIWKPVGRCWPSTLSNFKILRIRKRFVRLLVLLCGFSLVSSTSCEALLSQIIRLLWGQERQSSWLMRVWLASWGMQVRMGKLGFCSLIRTGVLSSVTMQKFCEWDYHFNGSWILEEESLNQKRLYSSATKRRWSILQINIWAVNTTEGCTLRHCYHLYA